MPPRIHLSRLRKLPIVSADGRKVGRWLDVSATLSTEMPRLRRLAIAAGRHTTLVVPWALVASRDDSGLHLTAEADDLRNYEVDRGTRLDDIVLDADEVLLGRDVLDSQAVDLTGRRLSRVSDVLLTDDGGPLAVVAVDLGLGSLLRRMGVARLGDRIEPVLVAWDQLHLASGRGHSVQLATSTAGISRLDPDALADVIARLDTESATEVLRSVGPGRSADVLDASHHLHRRRLVRALSSEEAHRVIDAASVELGRALKDVREEPATRGRRFRRTAGWRTNGPVRSP